MFGAVHLPTLSGEAIHHALQQEREHEPASPDVPPLCQRVIEDIHKFELKTHMAYLRAVNKLPVFFNCVPSSASVEDRHCFQLYRVDQGGSPITFNAIITGLRVSGRFRLVGRPAALTTDALAACWRAGKQHAMSFNLGGICICICTPARRTLDESVHLEANMEQTGLVLQRTEHIVAVLQKTIHMAKEKTPAGQLAVGKLYEINQNYSGASQMYRQLRSDRQYGEEAGMRLAIVLHKSGQNEEGLRLSLELARSNDKLACESPTTHDITSIHTVIGDALTSMGNESDAAHHFQQSVKLHPKDVHASAMLARLALKQGDVARAEQYARAVPESTQRYNDILANVELSRTDSTGALVAKLSAAVRRFDGA